MHEKNPYRDNPPNFMELAESYKWLKPHLIHTGPSSANIDFKDPRSLRELTYALLWKDFNLRLEIPLDSLTPPVPNRLDYILCLRDLLECGDDDSYCVVDLGTGASCIYPLLGCRTFSSWSFIALESDRRLYEYALENIRRNDLLTRINVIHNTSEDLLPLFVDNQDHHIHAIMCNPPFYSSSKEIAALASNKELPPFAACTGSDAEMITAGGEVGFVTRMLDESAKNQDMKTRVTWYTSLLGRKEDVNVIETLCKHRQVNRFKTQMAPKFGSKKKRSHKPAVELL
ncbi:hypothetical protein SmJEL517_g03752 [Synchytrium microbalum]|uniref:U6 small nuclear RNA (adenine-(43)-N(6))-methyltransferase n=1 Tax=Synchytrium microbalum TaxID=1806994 RepID=A0A507C5T6_9FUNG|nr:uncharacterized protein SmJEL517_g03752 [Synchytrium microbalum]TPX33336.1 hypothetical protein SmJEL517_g03752 [Synchytrium microbalum]